MQLLVNYNCKMRSFAFLCLSILLFETVLISAKSCEQKDAGQEVPSDDPCETCTCEVNNKNPEVVCNVMSCMPCAEDHVHIADGTCCGPCEKIACMNIVCPRLRCPKKYQVQTDDMCCPECKCRFRRKYINPGPFGDPCRGCQCQNGRVSCRAPPCPADKSQCPDGRCCSKCMCRYRGKVYPPGPFGDKCDGCVCGDKRRVTCTSPACPKHNLQCVDSVRGEDCCNYCPNGKTCFVYQDRTVILQYGEFKTVKNNVCTCAGDPWYPFAFCAAKTVRGRTAKVLEENKEFMAPYNIPKS